MIEEQQNAASYKSLLAFCYNEDNSSHMAVFICAGIPASTSSFSRSVYIRILLMKLGDALNVSYFLDSFTHDNNPLKRYECSSARCIKSYDVC